MGSNPIFHPRFFKDAHYQHLASPKSVFAPNFGASCANFELKRLLPSEDMYPFKKATLNDCSGDLSRRWYIEFYGWDVQKSALIRKRFYEINNITTDRDRRIYANRIIRQLNKLLEEGYHFDVNKVSSPGAVEESSRYTLKDAVNHALELKKPSLRSTSYPSYKSAVTLFQKWASDNRLQDMDIVYFDKLRAVYFNDYLLAGCGYAGKSVNGRVSYLKSLFQILVEHEIIRDNPFRNFKKQKEGRSHRNMALSEKQMSDIKKILTGKDPELWLFIQFIYYCYLRPNEVRQLKKSYVRLGNSQIYIPGPISKNGKDGYVTIPESFRRVLAESQEFNSPGEYVFESRNKENPVSKNMMGYRYRNLVKGLKLGRDFTLYSWKHSGVVAAYNAGIDIKTIQSQCRHHSLEQTDIYLKSLGLNVNLAVNKIPPL